MTAVDMVVVAVAVVVGKAGESLEGVGVGGGGGEADESLESTGGGGGSGNSGGKLFKAWNLRKLEKPRDAEVEVIDGGRRIIWVIS